MHLTNFNFKNETFSNILKEHFFKYPSPANLNYFWNFGFISFFFLIIQIFTGIFLAMHYSPDVSLAFSSIQHIMRDVNYGWLIRYMHMNGASFFFIAVYLHILRSFFYKSFSFQNRKIWISGMCIYLLMMLTAFIGYVLPWGQMSFWGATVITNFLSVIPLIGESLVYWLWGGFSVDNPTLNRFYSLHFVFPLVILFLVVIHFIFLHEKGSSNPSSLNSHTVNRLYLNLYPYFILKDIIGLSLFLFFYFFIIFFFPEIMNHSDNYIEANSLVTPTHIVPEWYFLPFYAILRSIPNKTYGIITMLLSILLLFFLPFFHKLLLKINKGVDIFIPSFLSPNINLIYRSLVYFFLINFILLGWLGGKVAETPYVELSQFLLFFYFFFLFSLIGIHFLYILFIRFKQ